MDSQITAWPRWQIVLIILGALAIWLGFPNNFLNFPPLILLWPLCSALSGLLAKNLPRAFFYGWLANFLGGSCALYWLYLPVKNVGGLPFIPAFLCALLISACLGVQGGLFAMLAAFLRQLPAWRLALALSLAWYLLEYSLAVIMGFPWLQMAGALAVWVLMIQAANLVGAWLACALWLLALLLIVLGFRGKIKTGSVLTGIGIALLLSAYGWFQLAAVEDQKGEQMRAIFVEGAVDQNQKWVPSYQRWNLDLYINLTRDALEKSEGEKSQLVIWPETAMPFFFERNRQLAESLQAALKSFGKPLLFGGPGTDAQNSVYNRAFLLGPDGQLQGFYDKEHLVPFGEYLPSWLDFKFLEALLQGVGVYSEGQATSPLRYDSLALGVLICYEGIFPWLAESRVRDGANILVDISNDGWFGLSPAARQHLFLTVPRCVEQNRWLLRATNTGISAVVDGKGKVRMRGEQFERGYLFATASLETGQTLYARIAGWLYAVALGIFLLCALPGFRIGFKAGKRGNNVAFK